MNVVAHNLIALNAQRQLNVNTESKAKTSEKLSSGYKINRAADDAAGLSISEKMRRQIRGLEQGVANTQEGISLCQVADGALSEVVAMLHRVTELSVKAANGTNTQEERKFIQQEINQILSEIDRVGDSTSFNETPVFRGADTILHNADGTPLIESEIPLSDFTLFDMSLGTMPFDFSSNANHLGLQAIVNNAGSGAYGKTFNLIYGQGSTSSSSFRLSYELTPGNTTTREINLSSLPISGYNYDTAAQTWSRDFDYTAADGFSMTITQKVVLDESDTNYKNYKISYEFTNNSAGTDAEIQFMFHADTAYNNNDKCEGYFVNGARIGGYSIYSPTGTTFSGVPSSKINTSVPDSISIVDVDNALSFSEKLTFDDKPDLISVGFYASIDDWSYYDSTAVINSALGTTTNNADLGISLQWKDTLNSGSSVSHSFTYGIVATKDDTNIDEDDITMSKSPTTTHGGKYRIWIQSGNEDGDGMWLEIDEMNAEVLGLKNVDVSTADGAGHAINLAKEALEKVLNNRSKIGAQQNRQEHTVSNERNVIENTVAAESRIRDTDMAKEMVKLSNDNILSQVGQSMLAQANQSLQGMLNLING
ncbi:flagellin [Kineothrix alysoides]|uniref:Flagellin n=1 Tax=Kineothrix alysoides TaxID=1469948 RepID=A0A4R1R4W6_9FIRM|nr:flagellin [Kineothrix alysoides]TCL60312.1 flagellin [Kineothrix alysoides]